MLKRLSKIVVPGTPYYIQIVKNGNYEEAWRINFSDGRPTKNKIENFVKGNVSVVALEAFFKTNDGLDAYFGVKYFPELEMVKGFSDFLDKVCDGIWSSPRQTFPSIVEAVSENITGYKDRLLTDDKLDYIVLILVVNWWKAYGERKIWNKQEPKLMNKKMLEEKLSGSLPLTSDKNYAGLELIFDDNHHWFTVQVSNKEGNNYVLDEERILNFLRETLNFRIL